jgi:hypothetical protein
MTVSKPRHSKEEFALRGDGIYERSVLPVVQEADRGKFVAIDIETGDYEMNSDELAAVDRLRHRVPQAQIWMRRVGSRYLRTFGGRLPSDVS